MALGVKSLQGVPLEPELRATTLEELMTEVLNIVQMSFGKAECVLMTWGTRNTSIEVLNQAPTRIVAQTLTLATTLTLTLTLTLSLSLSLTWMKRPRRSSKLMRIGLEDASSTFSVTP